MMQSSSTEFRLRYIIHAAIFALGFWAPWNLLLPQNGLLAGHQSAWLALASLAARNTSLSFVDATIALLLFGTACAAAAAALRTWSTAYLGSSTVTGANMLGERVVAEGPYRHVRNPLYLGTWLHSLALALLMSPTGAVFTVIAIALFQARLIAAEEPFLARALGPPYEAYCAAVPRILPSLVPQVPSAGAKAHWPQAILAELYMIAVALAFATFGWRYNAFLLIKCVVIAFGISLVARAFTPLSQTANSKRPASDPGL